MTLVWRKLISLQARQTDASGWRRDNEVACDACGICMPAALDPAHVYRGIDRLCPKPVPSATLPPPASD